MFNRNIVFLLLAFFVPNTFAGANTGDTAWILTSTALVLFMTLPGLALFYGGLVRTKNVLSVLMQCFAIACLISVCWVVYGYSLAFKGNGVFIGDLSSLFLNNIGRDSLSGTLPETVFITFQMTFAIITPALVVGAFAERMKFGAPNFILSAKAPTTSAGVMIANVIWNVINTVSGRVPESESRPMLFKNNELRSPIKTPLPLNARL